MGERYMYHTELSRFRFRQNLEQGRGGCRYYRWDDARDDMRELARDAVRLAKRHGMDVVADMSETRRNPQGYPIPCSMQDLENDARETRRVLDALRLAHVALAELPKHSLAAFVVDAPSEACSILNDGLVACRSTQGLVW